MLDSLRWSLKMKTCKLGRERVVLNGHIHTKAEKNEADTGKETEMNGPLEKEKVRKRMTSWIPQLCFLPVSV